MKERPIRCHGHEVRAIMTGRQTQLRRVVKPQPKHIVWFEHQRGWCAHVRDTVPQYEMVDCPYGVPGDRLRMLTTWATEARFDEIRPSILPNDARIWSLFNGNEKPEWAGKLRAGRFMPKSLRGVMPLADVVSVRVERLNEISEADARSEGVLGSCGCWSCCDGEHAGECRDCAGWGESNGESCGTCDGHGACTKCLGQQRCLRLFMNLWDSINAAKHPWSSNPFVWVVEFKRLEATP